MFTVATVSGKRGRGERVGEDLRRLLSRLDESKVGRRGFFAYKKFMGISRHGKPGLGE